MKVITTEKVPIKMWLDTIEDEALEQAKNLANLPFIHKHVALMPDAHLGYGMPIGGVIACDKVIIPHAVGVDISCGVCSLKTSLKYISEESLKDIRSELRKLIPTGFSHHEDVSELTYKLMPKQEASLYVVNTQYNKALKQLGTLGGGNHFLEVQKGSDGYIWTMIHSGSRNLGKQVCDYYNKIAQKLNEQYYSSIPKNWGLAFLPFNSEEGQAYYREMKYCENFALSNRKMMMEQVKKSFKKFIPNVDFLDFVNINHNYAALENHYGKNVVVHRKGATSAKEGEIGLIPGSQGTKSYMVRGLGNTLSFHSCSHGAGRKMSRRAAKENLSLETEKIKMGNVLHSIEQIKDLDEAPGAYKDINIVMENQKDLVEKLIEFTPLMVIKG